MRKYILFIDRSGEILTSLYPFLKSKFFIVSVSSKKPCRTITSDEELFIYAKKEKKQLPVLPSHEYEYIFVVYKGEEELPSSFQDFSKDIPSNCQFIFITDIVNFAKQNQAVSKKQNFKIYVLGDIFSQDYYFSNRASEILYQTKLERKMVVSAFDSLYPIHLSDATKLIFDTFEKKTQNNIFYLFNKPPMTELSFARIIKNIDPLILLDLQKKEKAGNNHHLPKGEYLFKDYSLTEKIKNFLASEISNSNRKDNNYFLKQKKSAKKHFLLFVAIIITLFFMPIFLSILFLLLGYHQLFLTEKTLNKGELFQSRQNIQYAKTFFSLSDSFFQPVLYELSIIGQKEKGLQFSEYVNRNVLISNALGLLYDSFYSSISVFLGQSKTPQKDFAQFINKTTEVLVTLEALQAQSVLPKKIQEKIEALKDQITFLEKTIFVLPDVVGIDKKKTYLILFQNNMELRPTGGFIGSYGILNFNNGRIADFSIHDVYEADGKLKGHVEPPEFLKKYMGVKHLFLRDSNYDIDFPTSATMSSMLLHEETGEVVDGAIAIDMFFIENILKAVKEVYLPEYRQTVSAKNVYGLTQKYAQKDFFDGSTQKKDFLKSLFIALKNKITIKDVHQLVDKVFISIQEKHILFAFFDKDIQRPFTISGFSGTIPKEKKGLDFVGINEANIGGNKANYFLQRSVLYQPTLQEGSISAKLNIDFKNTALPNSDNEYKTYLQIILPLSSRLVSVKINNEEQIVKNKRLPKIDSYDESGKTIFGFFLNIAPQESKKITFLYSFPIVLDTNNKAFLYTLDLFKQPGTDKDPWIITVDFSKFPFSPKEIPLSFQREGAFIKGDLLLNQDKRITVDFRRK